MEFMNGISPLLHSFGLSLLRLDAPLPELHLSDTLPELFDVEKSFV
jgi:hypothetical protein